MQTYTFPWMNDGKPFDFGRDRVTPHGARASAAHKTMVLKEALFEAAKSPNPLTPLMVQVIIEAAKEEATLAQGQALMYWALVQVDERVKALGMDAVMQRLSLRAFTDMLGVLQPDDADKNGAARPLVTPT